MQDIIIDGCQCACESAQFIAEKVEPCLGWCRVSKSIQIGLVVLMILLVILGLIIEEMTRRKRMKKPRSINDETFPKVLLSKV